MGNTYCNTKAIAWAYGVELRDPSLKFLLVTIAKHADPRNWQCWPKQKTLAELTGMSLRTVQRKLSELARAGLIKLAARFTSDGRLTSSMISLQPAPADRPVEPRQYDMNLAPPCRDAHATVGGSKTPESTMKKKRSAEGGGARFAPPSDAMTPDNWRSLVAMYKRTQGQVWSRWVGPEPGSIGCQVPIEVLAEYGLAGGSDAANQIRRGG